MSGEKSPPVCAELEWYAGPYEGFDVSNFYFSSIFLTCFFVFFVLFLFFGFVFFVFGYGSSGFVERGCVRLQSCLLMCTSNFSVEHLMPVRLASSSIPHCPACSVTLYLSFSLHFSSRPAPICLISVVFLVSFELHSIFFSFWVFRELFISFRICNKI